MVNFSMLSAKNTHLSSFPPGLHCKKILLNLSLLRQQNIFSTETNVQYPILFPFLKEL